MHVLVLLNSNNILFIDESGEDVVLIAWMFPQVLRRTCWYRQPNRHYNRMYTHYRYAQSYTNSTKCVSSSIEECLGEVGTVESCAHF